MRSLFLGNDKACYKFITRVVAVVGALFWGTVAFGLLCGFFERNYLYPLKHREIIVQCADYYALDRALIFSVVNVESGFDEKAKSSVGAVGLMQITPNTAEYIASLLKAEKYDLNDGYTNVWFGCFYLKYLLDKFENLDTALCAYNAGEGNVALWLNNKDYSIDGVTLYKVPFKETEEYIVKIDRTYKKYSKLYANILDKNKNFE